MTNYHLFPVALRRLAIATLALGAAALRLSAADAAPPWLPPRMAGVTATAQPDGSWQISSSLTGEYSIESARSLPAKPGDAFALKVKAQVGIDMNALPELVCYDAQGREIPVPSSLLRGNRFATTNWQSFDRVFPALPNTASVRARIRGRGRGLLKVDALSFQLTQIDPYATGALISQPHAKTRVDLVLESNFGILNPELVTRADQDDDGKWALITVNLDELTAPEKKGEDWRSNFEDNPNAILWSDGAVLKSDSVRADRAPNRARALHYRTRVHAGPYLARVSDPGRPVAISLDGEKWRRCEPGQEINLGTLPMVDGVVEFWIDACYVDAVTTGPAYFDYVRLTPVVHAPDIERIFAAARDRPKPPITRDAIDEKKVPLTVDAPAFAGARSWPVRCGLPVPKGELVSAENVAMLSPTGVKIPSQARVTTRWPDGSVKWLFLDFMHDPSTGGRTEYSAVYGNRVKAAPAPTAVRVQPRTDGLEIDTGALRFFVSSAHFGLIENVRLPDGREVQREPIGAEIVEAGGRVWRALDLPVTKIEVEHAGPLHAVVLVETRLAEPGKPAGGFYHRARIHAHAGSPLVQVDYFVVNTDSRPATDVNSSMASKVVIKSFALKVRPAGAVTGVLSDAGKAPAIGARIQKTERVVVDLRGAEANEVPTQVAGWLGAGLQNGGGLQVGVTDFREQFPKALRWSQSGLAIDLWAEEGGNFNWIEGVGKTHQLAFFYGDEAPANGQLLANGPLLAMASPEWYAHSGAFGAIETVAASGLPAVEKSMATYMRDPVIEKVGLGFENYGDHSSGGYVRGFPLWDNNEYDLPAACLVHFVRTGDRDALRLGLASARHYVDVDLTHYSSEHADWVGTQHTHSHGLFGHHTAQGPDFGHAGFTQGLIWYTYLTGDPSGLEGARGIADWCLGKLGLHTSGMERVLGHPLMTLNDVYEATGDEKYLRGSAHLVDQAFKWEHPVRGGFLTPVTEAPAYYSGSSFNNGIVAVGLLTFNQWARLPELDAMLERFSRWMLTDVWIAPIGIATKGGSVNKGGNAQFISTHARSMVDVYERTKDPLYLVVPWRLTTAGFGGPNSKPIPGTRSVGMVYNYLPALISAFRQHGNPEPEPEFDVTVSEQSVTLAPGATSRVGFIVKNTGRQPIEDLRASFHSRLDFTITTGQPLPARLLPGESAECWHDVRAPGQINLSCAYNAIAYAHWSVLYRRADRVHLAHRVTKLALAPTPTVNEVGKGKRSP